MLRPGTVDPAWPWTGPSPVHVDDDAAAALALEDLAAQVEQLGQAGLRGHGVELVHGQVGGEPGPGGAAA